MHRRRRVVPLRPCRHGGRAAVGAAGGGESSPASAMSQKSPASKPGAAPSEPPESRGPSTLRTMPPTWKSGIMLRFGRPRARAATTRRRTPRRRPSCSMRVRPPSSPHVPGASRHERTSPRPVTRDGAVAASRRRCRRVRRRRRRSRAAAVAAVARAPEKPPLAVRHLLDQRDARLGGRRVPVRVLGAREHDDDLRARTFAPGSSAISSAVFWCATGAHVQRAAAATTHAAASARSAARPPRARPARRPTGSGRTRPRRTGTAARA